MGCAIPGQGGRRCGYSKVYLSEVLQDAGLDAVPTVTYSGPTVTYSGQTPYGIHTYHSPHLTDE